MMDFVIMTLSFTVALLLASMLSMAIVLNKKVMKWYMTKVQKATMDAIEDLDVFEEETV